MNQKLIIFSILCLTFIGFAANSFAVQDNVIIEGNLNPANRSEELYIVTIPVTNEHKDIVFSIYDSGDVIFSQTSYIKAETSSENFFVKFFPPLFEDNKTYAIEVKGPGLIGRELITIKEEFRSYSAEPVDPGASDEEKKLEEAKAAA